MPCQDVGLQSGRPRINEEESRPAFRHQPEPAVSPRPHRTVLPVSVLCAAVSFSSSLQAQSSAASGSMGLIVSRLRAGADPASSLGSTRALSWYFFCPVFFFSKEYFWLVEQSQSAQMCRNHYESLSCGNKIINQKCIFQSGVGLLQCTTTFVSLWVGRPDF